MPIKAPARAPRAPPITAFLVELEAAKACEAGRARVRAIPAAAKMRVVRFMVYPFWSWSGGDRPASMSWVLRVRA